MSEEITAVDVPSNVVTLSSGVRIQFLKRLPPHVSQSIIVNTLAQTNLDADGRVIAEMSNTQQLNLAYKMMAFNYALIAMGLFYECFKPFDELPENKRWLHVLKINPSVRLANPDIDFDSPDDQLYLYLTYFAFVAESDFAVLNEKLVGGNS